MMTEQLAARQRCEPYLWHGTLVNVATAVSRVSDVVTPPTGCHLCGGSVHLVDKATFYGGRSFGWPLAYECCSCKARVGCHPGTDIPLGSLADRQTTAARSAAHAAFDPIWQGKGRDARRRAYSSLAKALGIESAHISWLNATQCYEAIRVIAAGHVSI